ncbi:MAG: threonylcarbamoyl-AMP synthase [Chloracidobacterium sp.]|nr:threonylcarbamoyl-AMP synthase [Chloracidobacterium sp.]
MKTVVTTSPIEAAEFIKRGGIVAFPTETVYGLGANVFDPSAIAKIFEAKQRPGDNPLIAHVADIKQINLLAAEVTEHAARFFKVFFPGPLTIVLRKLPNVPNIATAGLDTIGFRMPRYEPAHQFLSACETPIVAPSANLSGRPSPTTWQAVAEDLDGRIDCILQGDATEIGLESTVVDCTRDAPLILRSGSVSIEQLRSVVPTTMIYETLEAEVPRSPGLRHKHYSPTAKIIIVERAAEIGDTESAAYIGLDRLNVTFVREHICSTVGDYAHSLFEFFRECDREGVQKIYCERVEEKGIGVALMDRIRRAAE